MTLNNFIKNKICYNYSIMVKSFIEKFNQLYNNGCIPYAVVVQTVVLEKKMFNFSPLKLDKPLNIYVL